MVGRLVLVGAGGQDKSEDRNSYADYGKKNLDKKKWNNAYAAIIMRKRLKTIRIFFVTDGIFVNKSHFYFQINRFKACICQCQSTLCEFFCDVMICTNIPLPFFCIQCLHLKKEFLLSQIHQIINDSFQTKNYQTQIFAIVSFTVQPDSYSETF